MLLIPLWEIAYQLAVGNEQRQKDVEQVVERYARWNPGGREAYRDSLGSSAVPERDAVGQRGRHTIHPPGSVICCPQCGNYNWQCTCSTSAERSQPSTLDSSVAPPINQSEFRHAFVTVPGNAFCGQCGGGSKHPIHQLNRILELCRDLLPTRCSRHEAYMRLVSLPVASTELTPPTAALPANSESSPTLEPKHSLKRTQKGSLHLAR
jgi:hypothetical protein